MRNKLIKCLETTNLEDNDEMRYTIYKTLSMLTKWCCATCALGNIELRKKGLWCEINNVYENKTHCCEHWRDKEEW